MKRRKLRKPFLWLFKTIAVATCWVLVAEPVEISLMTLLPYGLFFASAWTLIKWGGYDLQ